VVQCRGRENGERLWVSAWCLSEKARGGGELSINGHVFLRLGEVTKIEPLRQCLLNCRNAYTQEAEVETHKKRRSRAEQIKRQGN